jgi:2-isopropylmalate synthase
MDYSRCPCFAIALHLIYHSFLLQGDLIAFLMANTPGSEKVTWSTHCHNDLGMATGNTLAGVLNGARQVEVAINGIGERAGNCALEEVVMAIQTRPHLFPVHMEHIKSEGIMRASNLVRHFTGMVVQPNKAIVGVNAFAHEAGIHQDGVLKHAQTYEIMTPESVGLTTNSLVLGKHSGRAAYKDRLLTLGYDHMSDEDVRAITARCKEVADEKKVVTDEDIHVIALERVSGEVSLGDGEGLVDRWSLKSVNVTGGSLIKPTATVTLGYRAEADSEVVEISEVAIGTGPVDAAFQAITKAVNGPLGMEQVGSILKDFSIQAASEGASALGTVTVRIQPHVDPSHFWIAADDIGESGAGASLVDAVEDDSTRGAPMQMKLNPHIKIVNAQKNQVAIREYTGKGTDVDVIVAASMAFVSAMNKMDGQGAGVASE